MKINFALLGLTAAQSGEGKDYEYDYPAASEDRWEFSNGVTFTEFGGKTTQTLTGADFVKALKLSCWNSNMIRDMNNDNKFQLYNHGAATVTENTQVNWKYAVGDLATGMNHQYGFEHEVTDEFAGAKNTVASNQDTSDVTHAQRVPGTADSFHKWGYNTDGVNRLASDGYEANVVAYHFGHADNKDNSANRPHSYDNVVDANGDPNQPADFKGFKDDWRFSLRMGGCLYEAQEWVYDAVSFSKTGRLTYTGDADFVADIFNQDANDPNSQLYPTSGSYFADVHWVHVFNAHIFPHRPTGYIGEVTTELSSSITSMYGSAHPNGAFKKTERDIEDFNVVMANPTYEGHGFLNFVATYHDHVDYGLRVDDTVEPYAGYRFYSTIGGYANVPTQTAGCNIIQALRTESGISRLTDARCGSAIYENFGDWYFRPAQTYDYGADLKQNYWAYHQPQNYLAQMADELTIEHLWTTGLRDEDTGGHRGFAISSFPHNELGQDFRFNIRTLHNMGMGVAKTAQMQAGRSVTDANGVVDTDKAVWSYYMYAVDSIKIAFPEFVARVNHCHFAQHKTHPNCAANHADPAHDGWQDIIVDGVTMKSSTAPTIANDSRYTNQHSQYGFTHVMGADNHGVATLAMDDAAFTALDASHTTTKGATFCANNAHTVASIDYNTVHGVSEHAKPMKPCASWCKGNATGVCGRVLTITGLLQTYDELHLRQYGTIQEVWVQLMYAYQEGFDEGVVTDTSSKGAESPFPNIFFSAPEVTGILAYCDRANMKCRGYHTDENQPYGGARENNKRVYTNNGFASVGAANDAHADSVWPSNDDSYVAP